MCIICNCVIPAGGDTSAIYQASDVLHSYLSAQNAMKKAASAMLAFSKDGALPEHKKRYDRAHKQMLRVMRDWNMIEHTREIPLTEPAKSQPQPVG